MESNELKGIFIKNSTCDHFDDIINIENFNHTKMFLFMTFGSKPLHIRFDEVDGFIRVYDGIRYLVLFGPETHDAIYDEITYLKSQKSTITYIISHNYAQFKIDSYDFYYL